MNNFRFLAGFGALFVAMIVFGCGGGGGGGSTTSTTSTTSSTGTDVTEIRVEAQTAPGVYIDPRNIQLGQTVKFVLVNYDLTAGTSTVVNGTPFFMDTALGTLSSNGTFVASKTSTTDYKVTSTYGGTAYSAAYTVTPVQPILTGRVIDSNSAAVPFVTVQFFDSSSNVVGATSTDGSGNFTASVPTSAVRFNFDSTTLSSATYFRYFTYQGGSYDPLATSCSAPLPTLTGTGTFGLPAVPVVYATVSGGVANTPPAAPGCSP